MVTIPKSSETGPPPEAAVVPKERTPERGHLKIVEAQRNIGSAAEKVGSEGQELYIAWVNASLDAKEPVLEEDYSDIKFETDKHAVTARHIPTQLHTDFVFSGPEGTSGHVLPGADNDYKKAGQDRLNRYLKKHLQYWNTVLVKHDEKAATPARLSKILDPLT